MIEPAQAGPRCTKILKALNRLLKGFELRGARAVWLLKVIKFTQRKKELYFLKNNVYIVRRLKQFQNGGNEMNINVSETIKEALELLEYIPLNGKNDKEFICKKSMLKFFIKGCKNESEFNFNFINSFHNQSKNYFFIYYENKNVFASSINQDEINKYIDAIFLQGKIDIESILELLKDYHKLNELKKEKSTIDLNPKIIQFQVVNIGSNTYRYSLLDNGEIIKETYSSCGNFTK